MVHHHHLRRESEAAGSFWTSRSALILLAFLAMGGALLFTEHRAHVLGLLPWLFIFACPLLHMFGHGGHGSHGHGRSGPPNDQPRSDARGSTDTWDASTERKS